MLYAYGELITDICFACSAQGILNSLSNRQNVYGYLYNYTAVPKLQANHGGDNNFAFGPAQYSDLFRRHTMTEADQEFAMNFLKYFASFIKTGKFSPHPCLNRNIFIFWGPSYQIRCRSAVDSKQTNLARVRPRRQFVRDQRRVQSHSPVQRRNVQVLDREFAARI